MKPNAPPQLAGQRGSAGITGLLIGERLLGMEMFKPREAGKAVAPRLHDFHDFLEGISNSTPLREDRSIVHSAPPSIRFRM